MEACHSSIENQLLERAKETAMPSPQDRKIIKFSCPQCGAKSGQKCVTKTGRRFTGGFHIHRKAKVDPRVIHPGKRGVPKIKGKDED